ncbi:MAG: hypothetical protein H0V39_05110 [Nitrosomonas sp.]|nr:hypothetical protein [Nitrosomonas sp.]
MKSTEFKTWMESIERMSRNQRDKLIKRMEGKENSDEVIGFIERNHEDRPACPYCRANNLYRWGKKPVSCSVIVVGFCRIKRDHRYLRVGY